MLDGGAVIQSPVFEHHELPPHGPSSRPVFDDWQGPKRTIQSALRIRNRQRGDASMRLWFRHRCGAGEPDAGAGTTVGGNVWRSSLPVSQPLIDWPTLRSCASSPTTAAATTSAVITISARASFTNPFE